MNFIEKLTSYPEEQGYTSEDIIIAECIRVIKQHIEIRYRNGISIQAISGYFQSTDYSYGFRFVDKKLSSPPRCNCGLTNQHFRELILDKHSTPKATFDMNYIKTNLTQQLLALGLTNALVQVFINPHISFEQEFVYRFLRNSTWKTVEKVIDPKGYMCIYIEIESRH